MKTTGSPIISPFSLDDFTLILFGHSAFQYLNAGAELGIFEHLRSNPNASLGPIAAATGVPVQSMRCLLFGLTSLRLIIKSGDTYSNGSVIEQLFTDGKWQIMLDIIRFESQITYLGQSDFGESLRTGTNIGIRHTPGEGEDLYRRLSQTPHLKDAFYNYMGSWSRLALPLLLSAVDFTAVRRIADIGGGDGTNAIEIAQRYPHVEITLVDLPSNCHVAEKRIQAAGLAARVKMWPADMFVDSLPTGHDCFMFVHQLVIWPRDVIIKLLSRAFELLPDNGTVVIFNSISSDDETGPVMAALDSVYFVSIPAEGGMIHPWKLYEECLRESGFREIKCFKHDAWTPHGTIVASKKTQSQE